MLHGLSCRNKIRALLLIEIFSIVCETEPIYLSSFVTNSFSPTSLCTFSFVIFFPIPTCSVPTDPTPPPPLYLLTFVSDTLSLTQFLPLPSSLFLSRLVAPSLRLILLSLSLLFSFYVFHLYHLNSGVYINIRILFFFFTIYHGPI